MERYSGLYIYLIHLFYSYSSLCIFCIFSLECTFFFVLSLFLLLLLSLIGPGNLHFHEGVIAKGLIKSSLSLNQSGLISVNHRAGRVKWTTCWSRWIWRGQGILSADWWSCPLWSPCCSCCWLQQRWWPSHLNREDKHWPENSSPEISSSHTLSSVSVFVLLTIKALNPLPALVPLSSYIKHTDRQSTVSDSQRLHTFQLCIRNYLPPYYHTVII